MHTHYAFASLTKAIKRTGLSATFSFVNISSNLSYEEVQFGY